jgi:photosystem II stability/assembly factor-like uncharacterized protein
MGDGARAGLVWGVLWMASGCGATGGPAQRPDTSRDGAPVEAAAALSGAGDVSPADALPGEDGPAASPDGPTTRFASIGPMRSRFTAVAATPRGLFAATAASVRRSRDGGQTWALLRTPELRGVTALVARGSELFVTAEGGAIYHSSDDGDTWQDRSVAAVDTRLSARESEVYLVAAGKPHRWEARGQRWEPLPDGGEPQPIRFIFLESDGRALYANSYSGRIFRLELGSPTALWSEVPSLSWKGIAAFAFLDGEAIALGASGQEVYRRGAGEVWTPLAAQLGETADLLAFGGAIHAASGQGLAASTDRGATWTQVASDHFSARTALATDGEDVFAAGTLLWRKRGRDGAWQSLDLRADGVRVLHATGDSVLSISDSGFLHAVGGAWEEVRGAIEVRGGGSIATHDGEVFAATQYSVWASTDGGRSFAPRIGFSGRVPFITSTERGLVVGVDDYAETLLSRSIDGARTWVELARLGTGLDALVEAQGILFLTGRYGGTFRSADQGETWTKLALASDLGDLRSFVTAGEHIVAASSKGGVVRSADRGLTWERSGLDGLAVSSLVVRGGELWAGIGSLRSFAGGVHRSTDLGRTWAAVDPSFDARVSALAIAGGRLYAGTFDQGTWVVPLP